jgi:DNA-binding XRE family transcriptional regulator
MYSDRAAAEIRRLRAELAVARADAARLAGLLREAIAQLRWLNQRPAWVTAGPFIDKLEAGLVEHDASCGTAAKEEKRE